MLNYEDRLLLFFTVALAASESEYSLVLTDQYGKKQTIVIDESDLHNFPVLQILYQSSGFCDQKTQEISREHVPYEVFEQVLKPFCVWSVKRRFFNTHQIIKYLYSKHWNEPHLVATAYKAADFLQMQMTFGRKKAFINFLYDNKIADSVIDESELTFNKAGYLISSKEFYQRISVKFYSSQVYFIYQDNGIRYFDPSSVSKERITYSKSYLLYDLFHFKFSRNKIQYIDFDQLAANIRMLADGFDVSQRPIVDFSKNPLSPETKQKISLLVDANQNKIKKNLNRLKLRRKNLESENNKKLLYRFVLKSITILVLSTCLIRFLHTIQSIKKHFEFSLLLAVGTILLVAGTIFSFYKQLQSSHYDYSRRLKEENRPEKKRAGVGLLGSADFSYNGKKKYIPVYDNLFYIVYDL